MINPVVFGKFILLERVSVGGMAEVFRAKLLNAPEIESFFAIKRILPNLAEDEEFVSMFINEAKVAIDLLHPNVCQIHELGRLGQSHYIAMEYIAGKDILALQSYYRRARKIMSISQACFIVAQAAQGLDYAHHAVDADGHPLGIVHRDVSPQNLIVTYDGIVKLIDFGVAKAARKVVSHSKSGVVKGKFSYMSPEQAVDGPVDMRSDIFSLGIVFWELLTGRRLFQSESEFAILEMITNGEIDKPSKYNKTVPEAVERICMKALEKDPARRYSTAGEMATELYDFINKCKTPFTQWHLQNWMCSTFKDDFQAEWERLAIFNTINTEADIEKYNRENAEKIKAEAEAEAKRAEEEKSRAEDSLRMGVSSSLLERVSEDDPTDSPNSISMARRKPGENSKSLPGVKSISLADDSIRESGARLSISSNELSADEDVELIPEGVGPTVSDPTVLQFQQEQKAESTRRLLMVVIVIICIFCVSTPVLVMLGAIPIPHEQPNLPTTAQLSLSISPESEEADVKIYNYPYESGAKAVYSETGSKIQLKDAKAGTYAMAVHVPGFEKEWFTITLENGTQDASVTLTRELPKEMTYEISVQPEDAKIFVDHALVAGENGKRSIHTIAGQPYEIRVFKIGFEPVILKGTASLNMAPIEVSLTKEEPVNITVASIPDHYSVYGSGKYKFKSKMSKLGETPFTFPVTDLVTPMKIELHRGKHVVWSHTVDFSKAESNDIRIFADMEK